MPLDDLREQRLLMPEELWGNRPRATLQQNLVILCAGFIAALAAGLIWFGAGGPRTFVGLALFLFDLLLFLAITFWAVEHRVRRLHDMGLRGKIEGLD